LKLMVAAAVLLLGLGEALGGGGVFPTIPTDFVLKTSGQVTAVIVLDPNGPVSFGAPATSTGTFGTIAITRSQVGTATATFRVQPESSLGELQFGCNLLLTNPRFVESAPGTPGLALGGPLSFASNWLANDVTVKLFGQLGVRLTDEFDPNLTLRIPAVSGVLSQRCEPFPKAKKTLDAVLFGSLVDSSKSVLPGYPDLSGNSVGITPETQWRPGFLVLEVTIGFWALPETTTP
jgi:hypothetical protein